MSQPEHEQFKEPQMSTVFGGVTHNAELNMYKHPSNAYSWGGFANSDTSIYPFGFTNSGKITFDYQINGGESVDIKFKFEANASHLGSTEPSYDTDVVSCSGIGTGNIHIPSQGTNIFNNFILYLVTRDIEINLTNIRVYADPEPEPEPGSVAPLEPSVIAQIENNVPTISDTSVPVIVVDVLDGVLTVGTEIVKSQKRTTFLAKLFADNSGLASATGKITMTKDKLLGDSSVITKNTMVIVKATNSTTTDTSQLDTDEAMYVFMSSGDFTVFTTTGGNLKITKTSETLYDIYENYVDSNSPVTKIMSVGESSSFGTFTYVVGSVSGQIEPGPVPEPKSNTVSKNTNLLLILGSQRRLNISKKVKGSSTNGTSVCGGSK